MNGDSSWYQVKQVNFSPFFRTERSCSYTVHHGRVPQQGFVLSWSLAPETAWLSPGQPPRPEASSFTWRFLLYQNALRAMGDLGDLVESSERSLGVVQRCLEPNLLRRQPQHPSVWLWVFVHRVRTAQWLRRTALPKTEDRVLLNLRSGVGTRAVNAKRGRGKGRPGAWAMGVDDMAIALSLGIISFFRFGLDTRSKRHRDLGSNLPGFNSHPMYVTN